MSTINGKACVANGVAVDKVFSNGKQVYGRSLVKGSKQEFTGKAYPFHDYNLTGITELTPGETYTMLFNAKVDDKAVNCNQYLFLYIYNSSWSFTVYADVPISTEYQRVIKTFTVPKDKTDVKYITAYLQHPIINGNYDESADKSDFAGTGYIKEFKLEKGTISTPWTPAPEDVM